MKDTDAVFVPEGKKIQFTNVIVIDASGSMLTKVNEVIEGLKQIFADIKDEATKNKNVITRTIVVDFSYSYDIRVLVNTLNPEDLTDELASSYSTRGYTALYDAMGYAMSLIPDDQDGAYITVISDGGENDSKEYTVAGIKELVMSAREKKWAVTFMGSDEQGIYDAQAAGVRVKNTMRVKTGSGGIMDATTMSNDVRKVFYSATVNNTVTSLDMDSLVTDVASGKVTLKNVSANDEIT